MVGATLAVALEKRINGTLVVGACGRPGKTD